MDWRSLLIGFIIGALIAVPLGMAHSGGFSVSERTGSRWGFGPMGGYGMHGGMMDEEMHDGMEEYMADGNFTEMHDAMEQVMEEHMGDDWKGMHEYCEKTMGIEDENEEHE